MATITANPATVRGVFQHKPSVAELRTITPSLAVEWLAKNLNFRKKRQWWVADIARDITAGRYALNGETIKFNERGELIDGQHRLSAVVLAGVPIQSYVVFGVRGESTIDRGHSRLFSDELTNMGHKHVTVLAAVLRMVYRYERAGSAALLNKNVQQFGVATTGELLEVLSRHEKAAAAVCKVVNHQGIISQSILGFVTYMGVVRCPTAADIVDPFLEGITDGANLSTDDPLFHLRNRMLVNKSSKAKLSPVAVLATTIKAWNRYKMSLPSTAASIRWTSFGKTREEFPDFDTTPAQ